GRDPLPAPGRNPRKRCADAARQAGRGGRMRRLLFLLMLVLAVPLAAESTLPPAPYAYRQLDDPAKEAEAQRLMETIRCLTCQSQSIADSDAEMAGDLRHQIRTRIAAGEKPEAIRRWLIERYGD